MNGSGGHPTLSRRRCSASEEGLGTSFIVAWVLGPGSTLALAALLQSMAAVAMYLVAPWLVLQFVALGPGVVAFGRDVVRRSAAGCLLAVYGIVVLLTWVGAASLRGPAATSVIAVAWLLVPALALAIPLAAFVRRARIRSRERRAGSVP